MDRNTPELYRSQKSEQSEKPWKKPITWSTIEILQSAWKGLFRLDDISLSSHREALVDFKTACSRPTPPAGQGVKVEQGWALIKSSGAAAYTLDVVDVVDVGIQKRYTVYPITNTPIVYVWHCLYIMTYHDQLDVKR